MKSVSSRIKDWRMLLILSNRLKSGELSQGKDSNGCAGDRFGDFMNRGGGLFGRKWVEVKNDPQSRMMFGAMLWAAGVKDASTWSHAWKVSAQICRSIKCRSVSWDSTCVSASWTHKDKGFLLKSNTTTQIIFLLCFCKLCCLLECKYEPVSEQVMEVL